MTDWFEISDRDFDWGPTRRLHRPPRRTGDHVTIVVGLVCILCGVLLLVG